METEIENQGAKMHCIGGIILRTFTTNLQSCFQTNSQAQLLSTIIEELQLVDKNW